MMKKNGDCGGGRRSIGEAGGWFGKERARHGYLHLPGNTNHDRDIYFTVSLA
jgi:hypothetical protein